MWYSYKLMNGNEVGWYECDVLDFKKMWKRIRNDVRCGLVKLDNGDCWLYSRNEVRKDRFVGVNGWSKLGWNSILSLRDKEWK